VLVRTGWRGRDSHHTDESRASLTFGSSDARFPPFKLLLTEKRTVGCLVGGFKMPEPSCPGSPKATAWRIGSLSKCGAFVFGTCMVLVDEGFAQSGGGSLWTPVVQALQSALTGPIATGLAVVAIVVAGPMLAFCETAAQRTLTGIIFVAGMAVGTVNFMAWVFP